MALDKLVDSTKLDACLDAEADAIRAKTGDSNDLAFDFANNKGFADAIAAIETGATITDGIVVKARDADGYPTEVDFYGTKVYPYQFGQGSNNVVGFMRLAKVNYMNDCTELRASAFAYSGKNSNAPAPIPKTLTTMTERNIFSGSEYVSAVFPISLTGRLPDNVFTAATKLKSVIAPGITSLATSGGQGNGQFYGCTALETVEIGSVGYGLTNSVAWIFRNCTQSNLTITLYTTGSYADTLTTNIRNGATAATIIIKASEATTYGGVSYAAGDTILTSTP